MNNSNYLITINSNISHYLLKQQNDEWRLKLIQIFKLVSQNLRDNINDFTKEGSPVVKVLGFRSNLEVGTLKKFIHQHCLLELDNKALLDLNKMRKFLKEIFEGYSNGPYLNVRFISNNMKAVESYVEKDGFELV